jgi:hypothetical protein
MTEARDHDPGEAYELRHDWLVFENPWAGEARQALKAGNVEEAQVLATLALAWEQRTAR